MIYNLKRILIIVFIGIALVGCCKTKDYTESIEKVAEHMLEKLHIFYETNKRYPSITERNLMLKASGCTMLKDICHYKKNGILIESELYNKSYNLKMTVEDSMCFLGLYSDGDTKKVSCRTKSCLQLKQ